MTGSSEDQAVINVTGSPEEIQEAKHFDREAYDRVACKHEEEPNREDDGPSQLRSLVRGYKESGWQSASWGGRGQERCLGLLVDCGLHHDRVC